MSSSNLSNFLHFSPPHPETAYLRFVSLASDFALTQNITTTQYNYLELSTHYKNRCAVFLFFWHTFKAYNFIWYTVFAREEGVSVGISLVDDTPPAPARRIHNK